MKADDIATGLGALTLTLGLLRGKDLADAKAEANSVIVTSGPVLRELLPKIDAIRAERAAKAEAKTQIARCPVRGCVLAKGHRTELNPWCQDEHGTLFQEG